MRRRRVGCIIDAQGDGNYPVFGFVSLCLGAAMIRMMAKALATLILATGAGAAWAVPAAVGSTNCGLGAYFGNPESCNSGFVQASRSLSPDASVSTYLDYPGSAYSGPNGGGAEITYYYTVTGPNPFAVLPIDVDYRLAGARNSTAVDFEAQIVVQPNFTNGVGGDSRTLCTYPFFAICSAGMSASDAGTIHVFSSVNELGSIYINAQIGASYLAFEQTGFASVDPFIHIDHSFADFASYSIEVSDGVSNVPATGAVPEPAAWATMNIGLSLAGGVLRVRRRRQKHCMQAAFG
ncbi:hypothetical protein [Sphingomonas bacterium]|uniref:hypothetical protein n=1 Tax=Sphingomonas bacterium TaxID=1895847 RepID=UPI001C2D844B|nr:hypothetical protein [Sphingomonas bacterium]